MPHATIDITGHEDGLAVENRNGFDLTIVGCELELELTHEQAESLYLALRPFFCDEQPAGGEGGENG
jgi:hypothetical protein